MKLATETQIAPPGAQSGDDIELSAVMPCLNESATVGICVKKVLDAMERHGIRGEVIVADNGSTDGSREIAAELGARVVPTRRAAMGARCEEALQPRADVSF